MLYSRTMTMSNEVLSGTVCLSLVLLGCLPLLINAKPTLDVSKDSADDAHNDDTLRHDAAASADNNDQNIPEDAVPRDGKVKMEEAVGQNVHQGSQEYGAGNVEEMVHGEGNVHERTSHGDDAKPADDVKHESGAAEVEHLMHGGEDVHEPQHRSSKDQQQAGPESDQQYGPGDAEEMVHGRGDVHEEPLEDDGLPDSDEDFQRKIGPESTEHLMHGEELVHESLKEKEKDILAKEFQSGNVEQMVHGRDHVHSGTGQGQGEEGQGPYSAGEEDVMKAGSVNVHDSSQRSKMAAAGDLSALMRGGGGGGEGGKGGVPNVVDTEHLMHGDGGHEHDVRQLQDLEVEDEPAKARDRFSNLHDVVMHSGKEEHHDHEGDDQVRRGKTITYKDIMALGLDEEDLRGINLNKLLQENSREYDDWQRDRDVIRGESPEVSFWEQIGELRKRYLSFGKNDGPARDLTGTKLDPAQQKWLTEVGGKEEEVVEGEDPILHRMEILGSTASKKDRHKQQQQQQQQQHAHQEQSSGHLTTNGRDTTDL